MSLIAKLTALLRPRRPAAGSMSADATAATNTPLTQSQSIMMFDIRAEADCFFDDSSRSVDAQPVLKLIVGSVCTGKTIYRHTQCAQGYVVIDAAEIFLKLSRGAYYDFPSILLEPMNLVGRIVASRAVAERRHIIIEALDLEQSGVSGLLDHLAALGYRTEIVMLTCQIEETLRRNDARGAESISAYFAQTYHVEWLTSALINDKS